MYRVNLKSSDFPAQRDQPIDEVTIGGKLRLAAEQLEQKTALIEIDASGSTERIWDYGELLEDVEPLAAALASRFAPRERVTIWSPNTPEWVMVEYACALAGIVVVPANPALQIAELRFVLQQSGSAALFLVPEYRGHPMLEIAAHACEGLAHIREITNIEDQEAMHRVLKHVPAPPDIRPEDPAMIQYTSGTTGFPRGAVLSHRSLLNNARFYADRLHTRPGTVWANIMPMFHSSGCGMVTLGCLQSGCTMLIVKQFEPDTICRMIEREGVTAILAVPPMLVAMLKSLDKHPRDVSSVELISCGGAIAEPALVNSIRAKFNCSFSAMYGLTETSPVISQHHIHDRIADVCNSVGQPLPQTRVSIRSLATNQVVPLDTMGEICVQGYCNMIGYHNNARATCETVDDEGWLHTGDLGSMDQHGYLKVLGRVKELIVRDGENIFPAEIENVLIEHPMIAEVAVVGIPNEQSGESVGCFFRCETSREINAAELHAYCRQHLSSKKTPTIWCRLGSFPRTGSRKIQKFLVRDNYLAGKYRSL